MMSLPTVEQIRNLGEKAEASVGDGIRPLYSFRGILYLDYPCLPVVSIISALGSRIHCNSLW